MSDTWSQTYQTAMVLGLFTIYLIVEEVPWNWWSRSWNCTATQTACHARVSGQTSSGSFFTAPHMFCCTLCSTPHLPVLRLKICQLWALGNASSCPPSSLPRRRPASGSSLHRNTRWDLNWKQPFGIDNHRKTVLKYSLNSIRAISDAAYACLGEQSETWQALLHRS